MENLTVIGQTTSIHTTTHGVRVRGENFRYSVRTCHSIRAGESSLFLTLTDVNGNEMWLDVFSTQEGSFE